ncbi:MAG: hypothetical protein K5656_11335 [Lachnospiraceae bacterium]|nr:hypothetical protein [Lachnospiraceae bacterium]
MPGWAWAIIVIILIAGVWIGLYFFGKRMQKKQEAQQAQLQAAAQQASLLIIDKKRMKLKEANLPKVVMDQVPKRMRGSKVPIVKAKVGPQVMSFICDEQIFDEIPVKREVKARVSGIYIVSVKNIRGGDVNTKQAKPSLRARLMRKQKELQSEVEKDKAETKKAKEAKKSSKNKNQGSSISANAGANKKNNN